MNRIRITENERCVTFAVEGRYSSVNVYSIAIWLVCASTRTRSLVGFAADECRDDAMARAIDDFRFQRRFRRSIREVA